MGITSAAKYQFNSNDQWVRQIRNGNNKAFEKLFRRYCDDLHRFIWGYVKQEDIAEELVQDVFVKIWEERESLDPSKSIKSLLYRIGRNLAIDFLRHRKIVNEWKLEKKALQKYSTNPMLLDEKLSKKMVLQDVKAAIEDLPERRRLIFVLSRYNHLTYKEIACLLDISVNTVETQISRALKKLRKITCL